MVSEDPELYVTDWIDLKNHPLIHDLNFEPILCAFKYFRLVRRDGNCFYSTFVLQILEYAGNIEAAAYERLLEILESANKTYELMRQDTTIYRDFYDVFVGNIEACRKKGFLHDRVTNIDIFGMITYIKILLVVELVARKEDYEPFLVNMSIEDYCQKNVSPFFKEAEHLEIQALANLLKIGIKVISVKHDSVETNLFGDGDNGVVILHTPNHFEPIK